jgi:hypothetical protein
MNPACPAPEELSRALAQGAAAGLVEHLASCSRCSDEWDGALRLRALVRALPASTPTRSRAAEVRNRLVAEGVAVRGRAHAASVGVAALAALAAAAAVALAFGLRRPAPAPDGPGARRHGVVTATPGARYALSSAAPDEVVLLEAGTIHVEVSPLGAGERFRVRTADGEVEVRGTAFDVAVADGHLDAVTVEHGRVEVRGAGITVATLAAGEGWHSVPRTTSVAPAPTPDDAPGNVGPPPDVGPRTPTGSTSARSHAAASQRTPPPPLQAPEGSSAQLESPPVVSREAAPSAPAPISPTVNAPPKTESPPAAPETAASVPAPAHDSRDREDDRRDRRDERRERHDERRMR